jgi:hypothetical protein
VKDGALGFAWGHLEIIEHSDDEEAYIMNAEQRNEDKGVLVLVTSF